MLFRGFPQGRLEEHDSPRWAALLSAVLFSANVLTERTHAGRRSRKIQNATSFLGDGRQLPVRCSMVAGAWRPGKASVAAPTARRVSGSMSPAGAAVWGAAGRGASTGALAGPRRRRPRWPAAPSCAALTTSARSPGRSSAITWWRIVLGDAAPAVARPEQASASGLSGSSRALRMTSSDELRGLR
ncbi:hypothetical protein [Streptosporangium sp. CA-115845]|uniref:hypothetical protein n=1 Tax=Streptosporangium sp. CA-115845 TaxID=3240071 RepID=UPI003D8BFD2E